MKVPVWIEYAEEKLVDIDCDAIASAIAEDPESQRSILRGLNNVAEFLKAIPDVEIRRLSQGQIETIHDFLISQADRYSAIALFGDVPQ